MDENTNQISISRLIKSLPDKQQIEVLEIAHALNIQPGDDIIYNILIGLGYHKTVLMGLPDDLRLVAGEASNKMAATLRESQSSIENAAAALTRQFKDEFNLGAGMVKIAARNGATEGIQHADLSTIIQKIKTEVERFSRRRWFENGLLVASVTSAVILFAGAAAGWFLKSANVASEVEHSRLMSQLSCRQAIVQQKQMLQCFDRYKNSVYLAI